MEVDDFELLELVNDYQERCNTFLNIKNGEYKIPSDRELDELAEDFVCSTNDDELPIKEGSLTEEYMGLSQGRPIIQ